MSGAANSRIPVIVGVGQVNDQPADLSHGLDSLGLMHAALKAAERDCGFDLLPRLEWLAVVDQISFPNPDIHGHLAARLTPSPARVVRTPDSSGDGPIRILNDAANLIASGEVSVAAVVGGEAMRTANKRAQLAAAQEPGGQKFDMLAEAAAALALPHARPYGLLTPADVYPIYEQATRAAWGMSLVEAEVETAAIWSGNSEVAAANPNAWLRKAVSADAIREVTPENRLISFPYTKLMVANNAVNQGAAVLVISLAVARELGIGDDRLVFVGRGAAAAEADDYLRRDSFSKSSSMTAAIEKTLEFNEVESQRIDYVELYSCFPCIPKMARRALNWPLARPHSVYGGLTFGGAPVGNCMMHAVAAMVDKLRRGGERTAGFILANGGFATHNHAIVLSRRTPPHAGEPHSYDVQSDAEAARGPIPTFLATYRGPGVIESYVMPYDRKGEPRFAAVIGRSPQGERFLARVPAEDRRMLNFLAGGEGEPVGRQGVAVAMDDGRARWCVP